MGRAKQPVSINNIEFDALISQDKTLESDIPEYPIENGFKVSDAIIRSPERLSMTLYLTPTPVTWHSRHSGGQSRVDTIVKELEELYFNGEPVTVVTSDETYTDMGIESITISKSVEVGYAIEIPISLKKIRVTEAKTTTIPDSYGKSGKSGASAGSANTKKASSGTAAGGGGASSGNAAGGNANSGSGDGNGEKESKSSILYSGAKKLGLLD